MAIQIKLDGNTGTSRSDEYREDKVPATQGNVINTLNSYNEKLKKEYYDKSQARADENALQSSIEKVIQLLAKDTLFKNKNKNPNTSSEDGSDDRLEAYDGSFNEDNGKSYDVAGLVQKLNIIANLVSGSNIQVEHNWGIDAHGNNVGKEESTGSVPVIGLTRGYEKIPYTAKFSNEDNQHILKIEGLSEHSSDTVLSEKQVADMISQSVKEVSGNYDSQISVMLSYMLFAENGLPESYEYILKNTTAEKIQDAPMYVVYDEKNDNYYIKDLDGDGSFKPTQDYIFDKGNIQSQSKTHRLWKVTISNDYKYISAYYNNSKEETYAIPVPQKTLTVNLGQIDNETIPSLRYVYNVFNGKNFSGSAEVINGIATINVPVAANVTVNLPSDFDGELFTKYSYTDHPENSNVIINNNKQFTVQLINDQVVYAKIIKYTLRLNNGNDEFVQVKRYKSDVVFSNTFDNLGKTGFNIVKTKLGGSISNNKLNVLITKIQGNTEYTDFTEGEIVDEVIWTPKSFPVKIVKILWNGTSYSNSTPDNVNVTVSQEILYSSPVDGYVFNGIFMDEDCTQPINGVLPEINPIDNLYARYDIIKYNYSLITNGADLQGNVNEVGKVDWESDMPALPVLTRNGYTFDGWYTSPNFNGGVVTNYQKADTVYYAKWTEKTYTVNFVLDDLLSDNEKNNFHPYFKYKSITVSTSNLPMTIGDPIAEGFKFNGWLKTTDSYNTISSVKLLDFISGETLNLYAKWEAQSVPVKEEIYYQIDGSNEYDLVKTITHNGTVGQEYDYMPNISVVDGFEEVTPTTIYTVKDKDNVVKRYFNRKTYNITYTENKNTTDSVSSSLDNTFAYSDNNVPLKTPNEVSDGYSFASWVDKNGSEVSSIPAYTHENVAYTARYNQEAPVKDIDFSVNVEEDKITITKLEHAKAKILKISTSQVAAETVSSSYEISYTDVYNENSITTAYGFVFFGEEMVEDLKIVNASNYVDVPLKFKAKVPLVNVNYTTDANTRTITKMPNTVELESRFSDATGYTDFSSLTLAIGQEVCLRTKETFSRFASRDTSSINFGDKLDPIELLANVGDIYNIKVTKEISYDAKGEITIYSGAFEGKHGPLQYKTGLGNGWLDVNKAESGNTIVSIDRQGDVYFRYGENTEYNSGSPIVINMPIMQHTVKFDLNDLKTTDGGYHFGDFTDDANSKKFFTITVDSGNQLCKCDDYIKSVTATDNDKKWGIFGYNMGSGERATTFLKKEDGTPFNEASIINDNITLNMDFIPKAEPNFNYTTDIIVDLDENELVGELEALKISNELQGDFTTSASYGKPFEIKIIKSFEFDGKNVLDNTYIDRALRILDGKVGQIFEYKGLAGKVPGGEYEYYKDFVNDADTYTFNYDKNDVFPVRDYDTFNYKFASMFGLVTKNIGETNKDYCEFVFEGDHCKVSKVRAYSEEKDAEFDSLLRYEIGTGSIDFYHVDDIRATNFSLVGSDGTIDVSGISPTPHINVTFHSALINGTFEPCFTSVAEFKLQTVTKFGEIINSVSQNEFTFKEDWNVQ